MNKEPSKIKAYIGLGLFAVFIVFLAISSRSGNNKNADNKEYSGAEDLKKVQEKVGESVNKEQYTIFTELEKGNYEFIYTINDNGNKTIYSGKSNSNKMLLDVISKGTTRYYKLGDNYLDSNYNVIDSIPLEYKEFLNLDNLKKVYDYSFFGENNIGDISAYDIYEVYYKDFDFDPFDVDGVNDSSIEVTISNEVLKKVRLDLSNAVSYMRGNNTIFEVTFEFSNIGNVSDINIG